MKRAATITETPCAANNYVWRITDETGHLHNLWARGPGAPSGGEVGDCGTVEYRTGLAWGLWFWTAASALGKGGTADEGR